jgi:hypothetical protein
MTQSTKYHDTKCQVPWHKVARETAAYKNSKDEETREIMLWINYDELWFTFSLAF